MEGAQFVEEFAGVEGGLFGGRHFDDGKPLM